MTFGTHQGGCGVSAGFECADQAHGDGGVQGPSKREGREMVGRLGVHTARRSERREFPERSLHGLIDAQSGGGNPLLEPGAVTTEDAVEERTPIKGDHAIRIASGCGRKHLPHIRSACRGVKLEGRRAGNDVETQVAPEREQRLLERIPCMRLVALWPKQGEQARPRYAEISATCDDREQQ